MEFAAQVEVAESEDPGSRRVQVHRGRKARVNERAEAWDALSARLAETLDCLEEGHFLVIKTRGTANHFVQFAAAGVTGMRAEAVSNGFLSPGETLDHAAEVRLRRLGWRPPTDIGDGPVNWWRHYELPLPATRMASLALETLAKVYDVPHPDRLAYIAFSRSGQEILLPGLGLAHEASSEKEPDLAQRVDAALRTWLGVDDVFRDEDGDAPIRCGQAMYFVRVVREPPMVAVFSPMLQDVGMTSGLVEAVNEINTDIRFARAFLTGGTVMVAAEVDAGEGMESALVAASGAVGWLSDHWGLRLQARFGGKTFFEEDTPIVSEPGTGLYL